jgi:NADPH:quinone reductase-like Zn-dependent oxidoreductase
MFCRPTRPDFDATLSELCKKLRCRMAFDAVGGDLTGRSWRRWAAGRRCWSTARWRWRPMSLNPGTMIFKGVTVRGFWLSDWLMSRSFPQQLLMARSVTKALRGGFAQSRVAGVFDLSEGAEALAGLHVRHERGKGPLQPGKSLGRATGGPA